MNYARSEAIVRNQNVAICPKATTATTCASTTAWSTFDIQVFVDTDGNGQFNTGDVLLKTLVAIDPAGTQTGFDQSASGSPVFGSAGFARTAPSFQGLCQVFPTAPASEGPSAAAGWGACAWRPTC